MIVFIFIEGAVRLTIDKRKVRIGKEERIMNRVVRSNELLLWKVVVFKTEGAIR